MTNDDNDDDDSSRDITRHADTGDQCDRSRPVN